MDDNYQQWCNLTLDINEIFPISFYKSCKKRLKDEEMPQVIVSSNLNLEGQFNEVWLILTQHRIFVMEEKEEEINTRHYYLKDIKGSRFFSFYGAGNIQIEMENGVVELVRFTRRYMKKFSLFLELVQKAQNDQLLDINTELNDVKQEAVYGENRCPNCGATYPRDSTICLKCSNKRTLFKRLFVYLKPYQISILLMFLTTFAFTFVNLIPPYIQRYMVDDVIAKKRFDHVKWVAAAILLVHVFQAVLQGLRTYQLSWLGQKITYDFRSDVYTHLQKLGLSYYDKRMTGSIMTRVTGDTQELQQFVVNGLEKLIIDIFTITIITFILFSMDWKLALIVLIPTPVIFLGTKYYTQKVRKIFHRIWRRRSYMNAVLGGTIPGIRVVKAFAQEQEEVRKFQNAMDDYFQEQIRAIKYRSVFFPIISLSTTIGAVLIWGYGGNRVIVGDNLSVGTLMAFIGYMWRFYQPVQDLSNLSGQFQRALTAMERVFEVLDQEPEFEQADGTKILPEIAGNIVFKNVSFRYEVEEEVLKGINLEIKPGEVIGLVGSSGSGKSTLVNLVAGFYKPTEGSIYIDGYDINKVDLKSLRSQIGFVLQEPYLFYGTIDENIAYGKPDATMEEIIWAAKAANAHEFIMEFPDGYDTLLGERGVGLSGGQKQRISIARAILKDPRILILDEATSSVDTTTEKLIQEAIDRLIQNRTTIAIAHRLSTLRNANRIIVLDHGEVVEEGTQEELMQKDGIFRQLVEAQSEIAKESIV